MTAIKELRDAGIKNTLLIDCAGYGQYPQSIVDKGSTVLAADADKNTLFAIHMYEYAAPDATPDKVNTAIDGALGIGAPVVIGEFGYAHSGNKIAYQRIMDYCKEKELAIWAGRGLATMPPTPNWICLPTTQIAISRKMANSSSMVPMVLLLLQPNAQCSATIPL